MNVRVCICCIKNRYFREAADEAAKMKDVDTLQNIAARCKKPEDSAYVQEVLGRFVRK